MTGGVAPLSSDGDIANISDVAERLVSWLNESACPLWSQSGVDRVRGGFHESLDSRANPVPAARRARVPPRHIVAFAQAAEIGWTGDAGTIIEHGLQTIRKTFRRPDGLYRAVCDADGLVLDDRAFLYDQAFMLLGFAAAEKHLGRRPELRAAATDLRAALAFRLTDRGWASAPSLDDGPTLLSNPIMHVFEAALSWVEHDDDAAWRSLADEIGTLALTRLIDPRSGSLPEHFDDGWQSLVDSAHRRVEPGHQFEWAWLLLRWQPGNADVQLAAHRMIDMALRHGVVAGFAVNCLGPDLSVIDADARLWPQTEWLRATVRAAELFGEKRYAYEILRAAHAVNAFLQMPVSGLWHDRRVENGEFEPGTSPASSLYHLAGAIAELDRIHRRRSA